MLLLHFWKGTLVTRITCNFVSSDPSNLFSFPWLWCNDSLRLNLFLFRWKKMYLRILYRKCIKPGQKERNKLFETYLSSPCLFKQLIFLEGKSRSLAHLSAYYPIDPIQVDWNTSKLFYPNIEKLCRLLKNLSLCVQWIEEYNWAKLFHGIVKDGAYLALKHIFQGTLSWHIPPPRRRLRSARKRFWQQHSWSQDHRCLPEGTKWHLSLDTK